MDTLSEVAMEPAARKWGPAESSNSMAFSRVLKNGLPAPMYRSAGPPLRQRWLQERPRAATCVALNIDNGDSRTITRIKEDESPTADEFVYFDSYEHVLPEIHRVKVCRDIFKKDFLVYIKCNVSNTESLDAIEQDKITPDNVDTFRNKNQREKNIAFLWSAFLKKSELFPGLLECGAEINCCDANGFSALHLTAYNGNANACEFLISKGANVNLIWENYTPLHSAAFGDSPEVVKLLFNNGAKIEYYKDGVVGDGTALHSAVKSNAIECLQFLMQKCADINSIEPAGWSPLHLAADLGHIQSLKLMLDFEEIDINLKTRDKQATPLHLAAENGFNDCVSLLLSKGANPNERNNHGQTALHLAARAQCVDCVETLLRSSRCDVNARDNDLRTPLHSAVGKYVQIHDVVKILIQQQADVDAKDKYGCTPLHIAALNEQSQGVEILLEYSANLSAKTNVGTTALNIITRKIPASVNIFYNKLDSAISMHDPEVSHKEVELKLDFRHILQHSTQGEISYLKMFLDEGQKEILEHPLCEAFLHLKWEKIRKYYIARLVFCCLFVISFSLYTFSIVHACEVSNNSKNNSSNTVPREKEYDIWDDFSIKPHIIDIEWFILLFITICEMFRKVYSMPGYSSVKQYVELPENIIEWIVIVSVLLVLFIHIDSCQKAIGAIAVLLGWTNLMFKIGQLPFFGSYVAMFMKVQKDFIKLFLAYSCLLIGFTISLCIILPTSQEFTYPHVGFIKVLVMMIGELNLINFLIEERANTNIIFLVIFPIFVFFITIVLMNLLVGIAVHDIQGLQKTAGLVKLERQTRLISQIELALFSVHYLPPYFVHLLQNTARISPSAYRVVLHVKPLNPREKRLPKELLKVVYKLAQQRKSLKRMTPTTPLAPDNMNSGLDFKYKSGKILPCSNLAFNIQELASRLDRVVEANVNLTKEVNELKKTIELLIESITKNNSEC